MKLADNLTLLRNLFIYLFIYFASPGSYVYIYIKKKTLMTITKPGRDTTTVRTNYCGPNYFKIKYNGTISRMRETFHILLKWKFILENSLISLETLIQGKRWFYSSFVHVSAYIIASTLNLFALSLQ